MRWGRWIVRWCWRASVVLSCLLFVAAAGMWGRSYWRSDRMERGSIGADAYGLVNNRGRIVAFHCYGGMNYTASLQFEYEIFRAERGLFGRGMVQAFEPHHDEAGGISGEIIPSAYWIIQVPHWFVVLLSVPLPLIALRRWRRKRRTRADGLCVICGYDLRASPARCPECGTAIAPKTSVP